MFKFTKEIWLLNIAIATLASLLIYFMFFYAFNKYQLEIVETTLKNEFSNNWCYDIDLDGKYEIINIDKTSLLENPMIVIYDDDKSVINQWNFTGSWLNDRFDFILVDDIEGDSVCEVIFLYEDKGAVYLSWINPSMPESKPSKIYLDSLTTDNNGNYSFYNYIKAKDINNDGIKEIVISLRGYFSLYPRATYIYNLKNKILKVTNTIGNGLTAVESFADFTNDKNFEFAGCSRAPGNVPDNSKVRYSDSSCWLMVFNHNAEFVFPPIEYKEVFSTLMSGFIKKNDSVYNYSLLVDYSKPITKYPIELHDCNGKLHYSLPTNFVGKINYLTVINDSLLISSNTYEGSYSVFNPFNKKVLLTINKNSKKLVYLPQYNQNQSKYFAHCFYNYSNKELLVYNKYFKDACSLPVELNENRYIFFNIRTFNGRQFIELQDKNRFYLIEYKLNPNRYFTFLKFFFIFIPLFLLLLFILNVQKYYIQKSMLREKELVGLQLKSIKNQIEPHFLFNTINMIGNAFLKQNKETAQQYLTSLSGLLYTAIQKSDSFATTLKEELEFVENYLVLQKVRFEGNFSFDIFMADEVDSNIELPNMLIHLHVENAIKHGLFHKKDGLGLLKLQISKNSNTTIIEIEDNGIGRKMAKELNPNSTKKGSLISEQIIRLYSKINRLKIEQQIIDLYDDSGLALGTKVQIEIHL